MIKDKAENQVKLSLLDRFKRLYNKERSTPLESQLAVLEVAIKNCTSIQEVRILMRSSIIGAAKKANLDVSFVLIAGELQQRAITEATLLIKLVDPTDKESKNNEEFIKSYADYTHITEKYKDNEYVKLKKRLVSGEKLTDEQFKKLKEEESNLTVEQKKDMAKDAKKMNKVALHFNKKADQLSEEAKVVKVRIDSTEEENEKKNHQQIHENLTYQESELRAKAKDAKIYASTLDVLDVKSAQKQEDLLNKKTQDANFAKLLEKNKFILPSELNNNNDKTILQNQQSSEERRIELMNKSRNRGKKIQKESLTR